MLYLQKQKTNLFWTWIKLFENQTDIEYRILYVIRLR